MVAGRPHERTQGMTDNHARAQARDDRTEAVRWIDDELGRQAMLFPEPGAAPPRCRSKPEDLFTREFVEAAYVAGREQSHLARVVGRAVWLLGDARQLFRSYEREHRAKLWPGGRDYDAPEAAQAATRAKADVNREIAERIEAFMLGELEVREDGRIGANPAEVLREVAEFMGAREGREVDHAAFDEAAAYCDQPSQPRPIIGAVPRPDASTARTLALREAAWLARKRADDLSHAPRPAYSDHAQFEAGRAHEASVIAVEIEGLIAMDGGQPTPAGGGNLKEISDGPLSDPAVVEGLMEAAGMTERRGRTRTVAVGAEQELATSDPRFDPDKPVFINGYRFAPAPITEG